MSIPFSYVVSQFVAGLYIYASVEIFVMVAQKGPPYPPEIILPQVLAVLVAMALVFYLSRSGPLRASGLSGMMAE